MHGIDECHDIRHSVAVPRPPSTRTKPPAGWPAWLRDQRLAKGWKQQDVFDRVRTQFGWGPKSVSLYGDIERGAKELTDEDKVFLAALYDATPADVMEPPAAEPTPDLIAVLTRQSIAIEALVDEMRLARERDQDAASAILTAAEALRQLPMRRGDAASIEPGAPVGSAG